MISRRTLLNLRKKNLILVDHNELSQTVDGIEFADINYVPLQKSEWFWKL